MRARLCLSVSCLAVVGLASGVWAQPTLAVAIALRPGPPIGATPEQVAALAPPTTVFYQGTPVDVAFTITNRGAQPYGYQDRNHDRGGRMDEYRVEVADERGRALPDPRSLSRLAGPGGGLSVPTELVPGQSFTKHVYLNQWALPLPPGSYSVTGVYDRSWFAQPPGAAPVRSEPVSIEIIPRGPADLRAYISGLGAEAGSDEPARRRQAVEYLGFTGSVDALPYLTAALYDESPGVGFGAGQGFLYITDRQACIAALLAALRTRGCHHLLGWLLQLYDVPPEDTLSDTLAWLQCNEAPKRAAAANVLQGYGALGEAALGPLLAATKDPDATVREQAISSLLAFRDARVTQALLAATRDAEPGVRQTAALRLGVVGTEAAIARLEEMLRDTPGVAQEAAKALEATGPASMEALRRGMTVPDRRVAFVCMTTLLEFGDDTVRPVLRDALAQADRDLQAFARNRLGLAVEKRRIPGPGENGSAYSQSTEAWLKWLERRD
jgi:HEAT repeat protein